MTDLYALLAEAYDRLNGHVDHEAFADYYTAEIRRYGLPDTRLVLDLGCGTGGLTFPMARRGFDMTALDQSPDMLASAHRRAATEDPDCEILWLCEDMTDFELYGTVDAVVSSLDCLNHLTQKDELVSCLSLVHNYLAPNGLFLFDLNSKHKFRSVYGDRAYLFEEKDGFLAWQNCYREKSGLCDFSLTHFQKEGDGRYRRREAFAREKCYSVQTMTRLLREAGFQVLHVAGDLFGAPYTDSDMRIYFTARAIKPDKKDRSHSPKKEESQ